ncbi:MAG: hypothetical protein PVG27_05275 [Chloroflexota bacterium]|jgi:hypothetical protein
MIKAQDRVGEAGENEPYSMTWSSWPSAGRASSAMSSSAKPGAVANRTRAPGRDAVIIMRSVAPSSRSIHPIAGALADRRMPVAFC